MKIRYTFIMDAGFKEIEHTADWELEVWAPDLVTLLEQAAIGIYTLAGVRLRPGIRLHRSFSVRMDDPESLLVRFLGELLFLGEYEGLGFDRYDLQLKDGWLQAQVAGAAIESMQKEIKAVTYHNLAIRETERGLEVNIVFDV